jgi:hypothetical protein
LTIGAGVLTGNEAQIATYVRQHLEPCGPDQSAEEEKTYHAML